MPPSKQTLRGMVASVMAGPDLEEGSPPQCRECRETYHVNEGMDPSPLCDLCAQAFVPVFAEALDGFLKKARS